jgi:class 3 adenylate cyclase
LAAVSEVNDLNGIAVHIASRIAAMAKPGQVLESSTVCDGGMSVWIRAFIAENEARLKAKD